MTPSTVDAMFKNYRFFVGRCGHLGTEISRLQDAIRIARSELVEDVSAIRGQKINDMPHGTGISNPTEQAGMMLASGYTSPFLHEVSEELTRAEKEYSEKILTVLYVDAWLKGLSEKERWIIERQVIDSAYWKEIVMQYRSLYFEDCSKDSLKRLRNKALEKIYEMAG